MVERFEVDKIQPAVATVRLSDILTVPLDSVRTIAEAKGLRLEAEFERDVLIRVDPKLTISAVGNLLDNAVKYTDEGVVRLHVDEHSDEVVVHVNDNCEGLSPEELKVIFDPFVRGRHKSKLGSGLGLAIARRVVEAQGGQIFAESAGGCGCHFWFTLPK